MDQCPFLLFAPTQEEDAWHSAKPSYTGYQTPQYISPLLYHLLEGCWQEGVKQLHPNHVHPAIIIQSQCQYTLFNFKQFMLHTE
jgi:hypothetical protein